MRTRSLGILALLTVLFSAAPAMALGTFGAKLGVGLSNSYDGLPDGASIDEDQPSTFIIGAAWKMDVAMIRVEANALYWSDTNDAGAKDTKVNSMALPVLAKFDISPLPILKLSFGAGLEPRYLLSTTGIDESDLETMVMYMPIAIEGAINLQVISIGLELRYERQLTSSYKASGLEDVRNHQIVALGGIFF